MSKKIYFAFVSLAIIVILGVYFGIANLIYRSTLATEESRIKNEIFNIANYCAAAVDREDLTKLIENVNPDITTDTRRRIENSHEFQFILKQLKLVADHFKKYCTFLYIIYPIDDKTYFIIGADYFEVTNLDKFSSQFNTSPFRYMQQALIERRSIVEPEITYDPEYNLFSISAYAPIFDGSRFLGVVGLDLEKSNYDALKKSHAVVAAIIAFLSLSCMVITTLFISEKSSISKRK